MKTNDSSDGIAQKTCPVMGGPISGILFVLYNKLNYSGITE